MATLTTEPHSLSEAMAGLQRVQKTSKGAPAYSRYVNRRLGRVLAAVGFTVGVTPNQVTALSALLTLTGISIIALVSPTAGSSAVLCLLLVGGYALDSADGQLARLRGGGSMAGEWLDHVVDAVKIATLHMAVLINWYRFGNASDVELVIPIAYQVTATVMFFVIILNDRIRRAQRGSSEMLLEGQGSSSALYSLAVLPTDFGLLCLTFALMFWQTGFIWTYGTLCLLNVAFLLLALRKWYREMRRYDLTHLPSTLG